MTDEQIEHMVARFLGWRLPENFSPDGGISFKADYNEGTPWPMKHEPVGTNLFDAEQAEAMVRHMVEGLPPSADEVRAIVREEVRAACAAVLDVLALDRSSAINLANWRYDSKPPHFGRDWDNLSALAKAAVSEDGSL